MRFTEEEMLAASYIRYSKVPQYRTNVVEYATPTTRNQRKQLIKQHNWSISNLPTEYGYVNMCSDSCTSAISDRQWSAMRLADE